MSGVVNTGQRARELCQVPISRATVQELAPDAAGVVWHGVSPKAGQFHAFRLPSLYPGVQW